MSTTAFEPLIGAQLRRLDSPGSDILALSFSGQGSERVLLARFSGSPLGLGLVAERPRGAAATATVTRFRHHLQGAELVAIESLSASMVRLRLKRAQHESWLEIMASIKAGNCLLRDADSRRVILQWHRQATVLPGQGNLFFPADPIQSLEFGARIVKSMQDSASDPAAQAVSLAIERRIRSLQRRAQAIAMDLARAQSIPQLRSDANLLLTHLHHLPRAKGELDLLDTSVDPPRLRTLQLSPGQSAQQQAEQWFIRARKLERGAVIARGRATLTSEEISWLQNLQQQLNGEVDAPNFARIIEEARSLGVPGLAAGPHATNSGTQSRRAFHEYQSGDGHALLVGRGAKDNDALTLHVAQPQDMFVHARDHHGAHVIVRIRRGESCPPETLLDAATLAAHFSDARNENRAEVCYAERRHVRKPRGAAAGAVLLTKEKVIHLRLEPSRLRRLLASKRTP